MEGFTSVINSSMMNKYMDVNFANVLNIFIIL